MPIYVVPSDCQTAFWDPIGNKCLCQNGTSCQFNDTTRAIGVSLLEALLLWCESTNDFPRPAKWCEFDRWRVRVQSSSQSAIHTVQWWLQRCNSFGADQRGCRGCRHFWLCGCNPRSRQHTHFISLTLQIIYGHLIDPMDTCIGLHIIPSVHLTTTYSLCALFLYSPFFRACRGPHLPSGSQAEQLPN
jgi:hypothetical protein